MESALYFPIIIFVGVGLLLVVLALRNIKEAKKFAKRRYRTPSLGQLPVGHRYIPGQFSEQMELDLRLPFRRFKELYPENKWNYKEYKRMQMQTAFRRSYSSQDNKRMVR